MNADLLTKLFPMDFFFLSYQKASERATSFPGSFVFPQEGVVEERPWFGLVTCLPDFSRLQVSGMREG